jgi:hypothetical protein
VDTIIGIQWLVWGRKENWHNMAAYVRKVKEKWEQV